MVQDEIAVIIPCYNEAPTIGKVVDDFHRELPEATVYVYDNASTDATAAIAMGHGATVRFEPRQGKGNVCRQMFRDIDADCYLMVDGDDTYPAEAAKALLTRAGLEDPFACDEAKIREMLIPPEADAVPAQPALHLEETAEEVPQEEALAS